MGEVDVRAAMAWAGRVVAAACLLALGACQSAPTPQPRELSTASPYPDVWTYGVAPAQNLSGSTTVDVLKVSDTLFSELQQVQGLQVLPVNKTLRVMEKLGLRQIDSAATAQRVAAALGVDALVVPVITQYDPYRPPVVGMVLQLYTPPAVAASEPIARQITGEALDMPEEPAGPARQPVSQVEAVFNASNQSVLRELHMFALGRTDRESALAEDRYLVDQDAYLRFVAHVMVGRLMEVEQVRLTDR